DDRLAGALAALGDRAVGLAADLAEPTTGRRAAHLALDTFGRLDGAFVSVGGPPTGAALGNTDDEWRAAFDSVFLAAVRVTRAVVEVAGGPVRLAYVLSTSVKSPIPGLAISNGLRPGLAMWIKQLAAELGPQGSRAVGLLPGTIRTERIGALYDTPEKQAANARSIPLRRFGEPAEFGRVAAFCLSDAASYLTGSVIAVDGGLLPAL
nr:SDR family oxidoreductase [Propionibacterium sp.]